MILLRRKRKEKMRETMKPKQKTRQLKRRESSTLEVLPLITLTYYITTVLNEIFLTYNCKFERISFLSFMRASVRNTIPSTKVSFNSALPLPLFSQLIPLIQGYGNDRERSWVTVCWRNHEFRDWIYLIPLHNDSRGIYLTLSRCIYPFGLIERYSGNFQTFKLCTKFCINSLIYYNMKFLEFKIVW